MDNKRSQWGSRVGFILAAAGSAVGLGNIWKFPGRAYEGGGGSFLLIYLLIVIFLGAPLMITELSLSLVIIAMSAAGCSAMCSDMLLKRQQYMKIHWDFSMKCWVPMLMGPLLYHGQRSDLLQLSQH